MENKTTLEKTDRKHLQRNTVLHINHTKPGMAVTCQKGILWLTQSGDPRDYLLTPGQFMVIRKRGKVLVEAMRDVDFRISETGKSRLN